MLLFGACFVCMWLLRCYCGTTVPEGFFLQLKCGIAARVIGHGVVPASRSGRITSRRVTSRRITHCPSSLKSEASHRTSGCVGPCIARGYARRGAGFGEGLPGMASCWFGAEPTTALTAPRQRYNVVPICTAVRCMYRWADFAVLLYGICTDGLISGARYLQKRGTAYLRCIGKRDI